MLNAKAKINNILPSSDNLHAFIHKIISKKWVTYIKVSLLGLKRHICMVWWEKIFAKYGLFYIFITLKFTTNKMSMEIEKNSWYEKVNSFHVDLWKSFCIYATFILKAIPYSRRKNLNLREFLCNCFLSCI